jgi:hypothetical protein
MEHIILFYKTVRYSTPQQSADVPFGGARTQRVLNDFWRTRLSCGRMIRLLAHLIPPPLLSQAVSLTYCGGERVHGRGAKLYDREALYK